MIKLALTGSIGMGKSTVAAMFERAGVPVFDADAVVRRLQAGNVEVIAAIGERFEGTVEDGVLDREALASRVLEKPEELAALEASCIRRFIPNARVSCSPIRTRRLCCSTFPCCSKPMARKRSIM